MTAKWRAAMDSESSGWHRSNGGRTLLNPLDTVPCDSPGGKTVDAARAMAGTGSASGTESDPHWNDKSVQVICAVLVLVLLHFKGEDRNLTSVQEIVSDPD